MEEYIKIVQQHYDSDVQKEWERLELHPFEFRITTAMMDRYIKAGEHILDIGGGPGRYSLHYAKKGCEVTLVDLSQANVNFAIQKSKEMKVNLHGIAGDARDVDKLVDGKYDHIFLMGPMYHLLDEKDRMKALRSALSLLKEGGKLYVSFIFMFSGMIYMMKYMPECLLMDSEKVFIDAVVNDESYGGDAFTKAFFIKKNDILLLMENFPLLKLHLFGQESILAPCEPNLVKQPEEVIDKWIQIAIELCERDDLLSYSEHVMYIGQKSEGVKEN